MPASRRLKGNHHRSRGIRFLTLPGHRKQARKYHHHIQDTRANGRAGQGLTAAQRAGAQRQDEGTLPRRRQRASAAGTRTASGCPSKKPLPEVAQRMPRGGVIHRLTLWMDFPDRENQSALQRGRRRKNKKAPRWPRQNKQVQDSHGADQRKARHRGCGPNTAAANTCPALAQDQNQRRPPPRRHARRAHCAESVFDAPEATKNSEATTAPAGHQPPLDLTTDKCGLARMAWAAGHI